MRLLFLGDVMGRAGRAQIAAQLPSVRAQTASDFVVVNSENASGGSGLSGAHAKFLLSCGVDCITLGDHAFDQRDMLSFIEKEPRIVRPLNYARQAPGQGARLYKTSKGKRVLVIQVLTQVFMKRPFDSAFPALQRVLSEHTLCASCDAIIVEVHGEATSEKMAIGHWCDGCVSLVVGTHTHIPTADAQILPKGTGYLTDAGMCGDYDSVIGIKKETPIDRFVTGMPPAAMRPATNAATLCGVVVDTDPKTGLAHAIHMLRQSGRLQQTELPPPLALRGSG